MKKILLVLVLLLSSCIPDYTPPHNALFKEHEVVKIINSGEKGIITSVYSKSKRWKYWVAIKHYPREMIFKESELEKYE